MYVVAIYTALGTFIIKTPPKASGIVSHLSELADADRRISVYI